MKVKVRILDGEQGSLSRRGRGNEEPGSCQLELCLENSEGLQVPQNQGTKWNWILEQPEENHTHEAEGSVVRRFLPIRSSSGFLPCSRGEAR
ncbi:hypothetical protein ILYODFUR_032198 [Ilyodon furcidens]|uniref:Uncharacterized protein n=1 Tax=Ilyodon furcidens TaxID=33524 RepID=A0ABV0SRQ4_9TELE